MKWESRKSKIRGNLNLSEYLYSKKVKTLKFDFEKNETNQEKLQKKRELCKL